MAAGLEQQITTLAGQVGVLEGDVDSLEVALEGMGLSGLEAMRSDITAL